MVSLRQFGQGIFLGTPFPDFSVIGDLYSSRPRFYVFLSFETNSFGVLLRKSGQLVARLEGQGFVNSESLHFCAERIPVNTQHLGGLYLIPAGKLQHLLDQGTLQVAVYAG